MGGGFTASGTAGPFSIKSSVFGGVFSNIPDLSSPGTSQDLNNVNIFSSSSSLEHLHEVNESDDLIAVD